MSGGRSALSDGQRRAISRMIEVLRDLPEDQAGRMVEMVEIFSAGEYLGEAETLEFQTLRILAEVIRGWEPDGVYEFARAWASTLVARADGFSWDTARPEEKAAHRKRILAELARRGF
jgi:hypothetical protein